ncbi:MAG: 4Fe-4S double cluster binding domain-containing protein [Candidatus Thorarchaeota archaeon]
MFKGVNTDFEYKYRIVSVKHLEELQEDIDKLRREGKLSQNKVYRSYIDSKKFEIPDDFPDAKSIIILAIRSKPALVNFHINGSKLEVMIPPNYYDDGTTSEDFETLILKDIIKEPGYKVKFANKLHRKLLAVRSGLGKYGRNNICYIDVWGSMITLYPYFTDFQFEEDDWTEIKMMDYCRKCTICIDNCITNAIPNPSDENFVINATNCIPVYNEIKGIIPDWIPSEAHNSLIGCMRCQLKCPANQNVINLFERFEDVSETETNMLLNGNFDDNLANSLSKNLKMFTPANANSALIVIKRNLELLIKKNKGVPS